MSRQRRREAAARAVRQLDALAESHRHDMRHGPRGAREAASLRWIDNRDRAARLRQIVYGNASGEPRFADNLGV